MKLFTCSRLFGLLLIAASLPLDPGAALTAQAAGAALADPVQAPPGSIEARLQRIAAAAQEQVRAADAEPEAAATGSGPLDENAISFVVIGPSGLGWSNGGWGNGGFYNGGFGNGGFRNGGFYNGGFRNGGFYNGGFRNGGFRNW